MISSLSNSKVKHIRKLKDKRYRRDTGEYYIEGIRIFGEAVQNNADIQTIIYAPELLTSEFCYQLINSFAHTDRVIQVSKEVFQSISKKENPQGIGAILKQDWIDLNEIIIGNVGIWLALDSVQDPGNLGTILRTSDAVGVETIIMLDNSSDPYDISSIRASMGSIFNHKLVRCNFGEFEKWIRSNKLSVIGTSDSAESDYCRYEYPQQVILLMGSEKQGLQKKHFELCQDVVKIPMVGRSDSLNLSVATSIVLYEMFNQRRCKIE